MSLAGEIFQRRHRHLPPCFRLYDSVHLNDPTEGIHIADGFPDKYDWLKKFEAHHAYIGSFIRRDGERPHDNLLFWRTYGRGGGGCSVSLIMPRGKLFRVLYEPKDRDESLSEILLVMKILMDPLLGPLEALSREEEESVLKLLATAVWEGLGSIRYLYKGEPYAFETSVAWSGLVPAYLTRSGFILPLTVTQMRVSYGITITMKNWRSIAFSIPTPR